MLSLTKFSVVPDVVAAADAGSNLQYRLHHFKIPNTTYKHCIKIQFEITSEQISQSTKTYLQSCWARKS